MQFSSKNEVIKEKTYNLQSKYIIFNNISEVRFNKKKHICKNHLLGFYNCVCPFIIQKHKIYTNTQVQYKNESYYIYICNLLNFFFLVK